MYRLLFLDIDDTLVTTGGRNVPARNLKAIRRAQEAGIHITVATGRGYLGSSYIWRQLGIKGPVVTYGGALIMDTRTDKPLHATRVPNELVQDILAAAAEMGLHAHIYQGDAVVYEKRSAYTDAYVAMLNLPHWAEPEIRSKTWEDVPKVLIMTGEERARELIPVFEERYAGRLKVSGSSKGFIEFNHPDANKGSAAAIVADYLGISPAQSVAVGDNSLDKEMILWAGLGCAVGNAQPEIQAIADMVLPTYEDMAVEHLIDHVLLKG